DHGQCRGAGRDREPDDGVGIYARRYPTYGTDATCRSTRRGGGAHRVSRIARGVVRYRPGDFCQRGAGVMRFCVVIPAFNEAATIREVVVRALAVSDRVIV